jgi:hypothetical protein
MAYLIGGFIGGLVGMFLLSRLTLWLFKQLGDNEKRILAAHATAYAIAVTAGGFGFASGGSPRFLYSGGLYVIPTLIWLVVDLLGLKGRRAKQA